jgi:hypothetical protein
MTTHFRTLMFTHDDGHVVNALIHANGNVHVGLIQPC